MRGRALNNSTVQEACCEEVATRDGRIAEMGLSLQHLRASEAKLAGIISLAADAIISVDESQRIVMYNEAAERIFGWSSAEALGKPLDILLPERVRQIHRQHVPSFAAALGTARRMEERRAAIFGLRKNGEEFPAEAAISKLNVGGTWQFTVILRDVTERKRIEHEEEFLAEVGAILAGTLDSQKTLANIARLAVRELADVCVIDLLDEQGELQRVEAMASDRAKPGVAEALRRFPLHRSRPHLSWAILRSKQPQMMAEISPEAIRALAQSEEHQSVLESIAPTSIMGVPLIVHDSRILGALVVASCRPERRYVAADLRLLAEVGRRAALALENARLYRAAERAVQARDDVLGIVAHDLRNPLGIILAQAAFLRRPGADPVCRKPSEVIGRAATRINRLIEDLLDATRMEAGRLSMEPARVGAAQVVLDSVEARRQLESPASVDLRVYLTPELPEIWADGDRLLQVFENLIGNAAKFTPPGGRITIGARPRAGEVLFWVADAGAGISADDLPHLFDRFWQARKADRRGAGLGLAIAKGIVEAHGGRIWVESTPGWGSTFYFTVPLAPSVTEKGGAPD
jgi:PAS domain S-box-containing protein